jgi:acyl-CoA dehydrogenase
MSLNGSKTFITNGAMADLVIVVSLTDPAKGAHGVSLMLIETGMEGFEKGQTLKKLGTCITCNSALAQYVQSAL